MSSRIGKLYLKHFLFTVSYSSCTAVSEGEGEGSLAGLPAFVEIGPIGHSPTKANPIKRKNVSVSHVQTISRRLQFLTLSVQAAKHLLLGIPQLAGKNRTGKEVAKTFLQSNQTRRLVKR